MTILEVLRRLDYGGVETYVAKLSAGLAARGHRVLIAAGHGPLVPDLERTGVRCLDVQTSNLRLYGAKRDLVEIIRREKVDVINVHHGSAGIPTFLAARSTGVPFLRSVHGTRSSWQRLSVFYWSPQVLVVSRKSRDNLIQRLGLPPERIIESFIGVDTARFSPGIPNPGLMAEFGMDDAQAPIVLHVSRFSREKKKVGIALAEASPALVSAFPKLTVLLVGSGRYEAEVGSAVDKANRLIGRNAVRMLGARSDIPELMRMATVTVGTASVALESLASGCPLVAAGLKGFIGIVTPQNFDLASDSCFGDHAAQAPVTPESLSESIRLLLADDGYRRDLARWGRGKVVEGFSLEKMVAQVEGIYAEMVRR